MGVGGSANASWLELESPASSDDGLRDSECEGIEGASPSWEMCGPVFRGSVEEDEPDEAEEEVVA